MFRTTGFVPGPAGRTLQGSDADVVNVHWVSAGTLSIRQVSRITQPVVLTLHDMWWFCGAEHYAPDEPTARWVSGYARMNRDQGAVGLDVDRLVWQRKRSLLPSTGNAIAPSAWLQRCARDSALLQDWRIEAIPNPVDIDVFCPTDRVQARARLGLDPAATLILFASHRAATTPIKGLDLLAQALHRVRAQRQDIQLVIAGDAGLVDRFPRRLLVTELGFLEDPELALAYSAADVVIVPSRQESLSQVSTEAQSCGTPVVVFDACGQAETVEDRVTGALAAPFDPASLAECIQWVLEDAERRRRLGTAARERAVRLWSPHVVAQAYQRVYEASRSGGAR
jgi:glycosyltransferase involved in cell wall biosynthesis